MFAAVAKSIFGSANDRYVRGLGKYVDAINAFEPNIQALSDAELRGQTEVFRQRLANGEKLDNLIPEAFATVREAAIRTLGQRHYDVQLIGGIAAPPRRDRGDENRRRQDARRDAGGLSQRARAQGRPRRHSERLSRPPRR